MLIVKKYDGSRIYANRKRHFYTCRCDCGSISTVERHSLLRHDAKHVISCGCLAFSKGKHSRRWTGFEEITGKYWARIKAGAENRNLEFKIKIEDVWDLWELQKGCCNLTGLSIILPKGGNHENVASLDRIDSSRGYIKDNIKILIV